MKKIFLLLCLVLVSCPVLAIMPYAPKEVTVINIGPKNPTFDESKYPEMKFYYTPKIKWTTNKVIGSPEVVVQWMTKKGLNLDQAMLLDKNGICDWSSYIIRTKDNIVDNKMIGDFDSLGEALKKIVEENRPSALLRDKPIDWTMLSGIEGRKFPDFIVENASGETFSTAQVIGKGVLPKLVFVCYIPADHQFKSAEETMSDVTSPMQVLGMMTNMSVGDEYVQILDKLNSQLYNH